MTNPAQSLKLNLLPAAIIICGFCVIFALSGWTAKQRPPLSENYADEDLAVQGAKLKGYSFGSEGLLADWYWMQALQYVGDKLLAHSDQPVNLSDLRPLNPRLLYPYLDNATTLDPKFTAVYYYGAMVLPTIDARQAVQIAEKGIAANPDDWQIYHYLGYTYWKLGEFDKASEIYERGAKTTNAPRWMQMMSARVKIDGGSRETARIIYNQMFADATDEQTKQSITLRLLQIDSLDEQDTIRRELQNFQAANNRCVKNWRELFPQLKTMKAADGDVFKFDSAAFAPLDPTGVPYVLTDNSGKCDVSVDPVKSKIPVH